MSVARAAVVSHGGSSSLLRHLAAGPDAARRGVTATATATATAKAKAAAATAGAACSSARRPFSSLPSTRPATMASRSTASPSLRSSAAAAASAAAMHANACGFHTVAARAAGRRRRRFSNVRADEMGLVDDKAVSAFAAEHFAGYTAAEKEQLAAKYTEAQRAALAAGEQAVDPRDLAVQGRLRDDAASQGWAYVDDFSVVRPVIDRRLRKAPSTETAPEDQVAVDPKFMDDEAFAGDFLKWVSERLPEGAEAAAGGGLTPQQVSRLLDERDEASETFVGGGSKGSGETFQIARGSRELMEWYLDRAPVAQRDGKTAVSAAAVGASSLVAPLGRYIPGVTGEYKRLQDPEDEGLDENGDYVELKRKSGLKVQEMQRSIATKVLLIRFVATQTRLGKIQSVSVVAIAGNGHGRLGLGVAKSTDFQEALVKAKAKAVLNMRPIRRYEQRTIYGNVEAKVSGTIVQLATRPPGFGLRVPHRIFEMARAVGISDLAARIPRSRNPFNTIMATYQALTSQPDPEQIAIGRGKKLVDARKVYYGGAVL